VSKHHTAPPPRPKHRKDGEGLIATVCSLAVVSPAAALASAILGNIMWVAASMVLTSGSWLAVRWLSNSHKLEILQALSTKYDVPPTSDFWHPGRHSNVGATPSTY
jgi:hypothetical protein